MYIKIFLIFIILFMAACVEVEKEKNKVSLCPQDTKLLSEDFEGKAVCELDGVITKDLYLTNNIYWALNGEVRVGEDNKNNATLKIQKGTTIFGKTSKDFLAITRGSKIAALGTQDSPIIFTSKNDLAGLIAFSGEWGGLVIAGNSVTNLKSNVGTFEFSTTGLKYGGDKENDNSGILKYVVVKYAGHEVKADKELNGISFGGVGDATVVDYIEVYKSKDDGIEIWGGDVNLRHIVLIDNEDDNLDLDQGYTGHIQYLYSSQRVSSSMYSRGLESDNSNDNQDALPRTSASIANFEFVGSDQQSEGLMIRRGSGVTLVNGKVSNFSGGCLAISDKSTIQAKQIHAYNIDINECESKPYSSKKGVNVDEVKKVFNQSLFTKNKNKIDSKSIDKRFDHNIMVGSYNPKHDWKSLWSILK